MVTGSIFLIVLLFVAGDIDTVINSSAPLLQILIHSTQNRAGAICLLMYVYFILTTGKLKTHIGFRMPLVCLAFATISVMTTSSRMIFAFARFVSSNFLRSISGKKLMNPGTVACRCLIILQESILNWACH